MFTIRSYLKLTLNIEIFGPGERLQNLIPNCGIAIWQDSLDNLGTFRNAALRIQSTHELLHRIATNVSKRHCTSKNHHAHCILSLCLGFFPLCEAEICQSHLRRRRSRIDVLLPEFVGKGCYEASTVNKMGSLTCRVLCRVSVVATVHALHSFLII